MSKRDYVEEAKKIWTVGVRLKNPRCSSRWACSWQPTSVEWFRTRKQTWHFIRNEISKGNFAVFEYKPLKYVPAKRNRR